METETEKRGPGRPRLSLPSAAPAKPKRLPVRVLKGHWPSTDFKRLAPGDEEEMPVGRKALKGWTVEIDADEARRLVQAGTAVRADAF